MSVSQYFLADGTVRWLYVIDLPAGPSAKRKQAKRRGFLTETAAIKAEKELLAQFGDADLNADGTVAAELTGWLAERELDLAVTSLSNYRNSITKYVIPHIGARQLYSLDKRVLHDLYKHLLARGATKSGGPLSAETVRTVHRTLMKAFKDLGVEIPGVRAPRQADKEEDYGRKGVWNASQSAQFLAHVADDRLYAAWVLALVCGLRRGELGGLKWPKVDLDNGVLLVHWQRATATGVVENGGVIEKAPKGKSKRSVALGKALVVVLRDHQVKQRKEEIHADLAYRRLGYVFCREDGTPYHPKYLTDRFRRLCAEAGVPAIALHDGRHTSVTVGRDHGVPQHAMQKRVGHARSRTTEDVYTHVLPEAERKAADIMEGVLLKHVSVEDPTGV